MLRYMMTVGVVCLMIAEFSAAQNPPKQKPIVAGDLVVNPQDIIAVYRPAALPSTVFIYMGHPGDVAQIIRLDDATRASATFDAIWGNAAITKDPGDDDARPLTRMLPKNSERKAPTLVANSKRILGMLRDPNRRVVRVFLDMQVAATLQAQQYSCLEIDNGREEGELVLAAYRECVVGK